MDEKTVNDGGLPLEVWVAVNDGSINFARCTILGRQGFACLLTIHIFMCLEVQVS